MKSLILCVGALLFAGATPPRAEAQKPADAAQPVDLSGSWDMQHTVVLKSPDGRRAAGVPICQFQQSGNQLSGACKITDRGEGPITGTIDGRHVEWQWKFIFCLYPSGTHRSARLYSDQFADTTFRGDLDANNVIGGAYRSSMQVGWTRTFFAKREAPDLRPACY
jgi:hypothetical protein